MPFKMPRSITVGEVAVSRRQTGQIHPESEDQHHESDLGR
jgi:hypothetical protein